MDQDFGCSADTFVILTTTVNLSAAPSPAERLLQITDLLSRVIAASSRGGVMPGSLIVLLWHRVRRAAAGFARLAAMPRAGTGAPRRPACGDGAQPIRPPAPRRPRLLRHGEPDRLPGWLHRRSGWLVWLVPDAAMCGGQLQALLADAGMQALAAASPQGARILRSLCRMLGVDPRPYLPPLPRRPRSRPAGTLPPLRLADILPSRRPRWSIAPPPSPAPSPPPSPVPSPAPSPAPSPPHSPLAKPARQRGRPKREARFLLW
jgi:hypothetical protein